MTPYQCACSVAAMIASFEKKPANGGTPTSASEPARNAHFVHGISRADAAHVADVLFARQRVDDDAGRHEEQRLEERVRHQVEHPVRVRADARAEEHVADLRHRRVRDHALDVDLHERDEAGDEQRERAHAGGDELDRARLLEDRVRARDQVDARGDHRRRVDQGRDRASGLPSRPGARCAAGSAPTSRQRRRAARARRGSSRSTRGGR